MPVPLGLDHPRWVDDPDFDLGNHLHRVAVPAPGGESEFTTLVAEVMGRPLTPGQPPWEMHVIEGMAGGLVGLIAKVHHSVIDGVAGAEMLAQLLDLTPEGSAVTEPGPPWLPPRLPSPTRTDDRRPAEPPPQPGAGAARRARDRPHRRAAGPLRGRRPRSARSRSHSARRPPSSHPSARRPCRRLRGAGHGEGALAQGRATARPSTTWCSPSAPARCVSHLAAHGEDVETRWSRSCRCPCAATGRRDDGEPPLRHVRPARRTTARRRSNGCAR